MLVGTLGTDGVSEDTDSVLARADDHADLRRAGDRHGVRHASRRAPPSRSTCSKGLGLPQSSPARRKRASASPHDPGPTGGYLLGFVLPAQGSAAGWQNAASTVRRLKTLLAMSLGHALIFVFGVAWLAQLIGSRKRSLLAWCPSGPRRLRTLLGVATLPGVEVDWSAEVGSVASK